MNEKLRCDSCRFWDGRAGDSAMGKCRRHAPRPSGPLDAYIGDAIVSLFLAYCEKEDLPEDKLSPLNDLFDGAVQAYKVPMLPDCDPDDWCGEWQKIN